MCSRDWQVQIRERSIHLSIRVRWTKRCRSMGSNHNIKTQCSMVTHINMNISLHKLTHHKCLRNRKYPSHHSITLNKIHIWNHTGNNLKLSSQPSNHKLTHTASRSQSRTNAKTRNGGRLSMTSISSVRSERKRQSESINKRLSRRRPIHSNQTYTPDMTWGGRISQWWGITVLQWWTPAPALYHRWQ